MKLVFAAHFTFCRHGPDGPVQVEVSTWLLPFECEGGLNNTHELFFGVPIYSHDPGSSDYVLRFKSSLYASLRATSPPSGLTCEMAAAPLTSRNFYDFLLASGGVA